MIAYKKIKDLSVGDSIRQVFLIDQIESRSTKNGKPYARVTLKDNSGQICANIWSFDPNDYPELKSGTFALLNLDIQDYKGSKSAVSKAAPMPLDPPEDLSPYENTRGLSEDEVEEYFAYLMLVKDQVNNTHLKSYLDVIFDNPEIVRLFKTAPASVSNRGAYRGGLCEHVAKVMRNAIAIIASQRTAKRPPTIDEEIIITGVLVHDLGKMYAYKVTTTGVNHTRSGMLLEHLPISYGLSVQAFIQTESLIRQSIPEELKDHVNHIILSHHGQLDYGSPVTPKTLEAQIVHMADITDCSVSNFAEVVYDNTDTIDDQGFVVGNYFSSKKIFVGEKN